VTLYGGEVKWRTDMTGGGMWTRAVHVGPDLHDEVPAGEQCRCGWMNIGVFPPIGDIQWKCEECWTPWMPGKTQCQRCGNRTMMPLR
jgi:hypothetical protein